VQYGATGGSTWQVQAMPATASIPPGGSFLVALASGATGAALPTPDVSGGINMSAANGKVALVTGTTALAGACPADPNIIDLVGFGTANCFEGTAATAAGTNTTAITTTTRPTSRRPVRRSRETVRQRRRPASNGDLTHIRFGGRVGCDDVMRGSWSPAWYIAGP
jgi:hypothetical protein